MRDHRATSERTNSTIRVYSAKGCPSAALRELGRKARRLSHASRLLEMPPIVRDQQAKAIQHAIRHNVDERRDHDGATRTALVDPVHPLPRSDMLFDETFKNITRNLTRRRSCLHRRPVPPACLRALRANQDPPVERGQHWHAL